MSLSRKMIALVSLMLTAGVVLAPTPASAVADPGTLTAVTPSRLLNKASVSAGGTLTLSVAGHGGVPASGAGAVVLNVTVSRPAKGGYLTVYPSGSARPGSSSLNFVANQSIPNHVTVKLGADGKVRLFNGSAGTAQVTADVLGWYAAGTASAAGTFTALTPSRVLDTRNAVGVPTKTAVPAGSSVPLTVAGVGGVPASGVGAVVLNVTVTQPTKNGYLTAYPSGTPRPNASNLNFVAGQTIANAVTVKVGGDGKVRFFNGASGTVHVIADLAGWFTSGSGDVLGAYTPVAPARILDTRNGIGAPKAQVPAGSSVVLAIPGTAVGAAVLNVTVTRPAKGGYVTVYPADASRPNASNLNFVAGQTIPNLVTVKVGATGTVRLYNGSTGPLDLLADIAGVYKGETAADTGITRVSLGSGGSQILGMDSYLEDMTPDADSILFSKYANTCEPVPGEGLFLRDRGAGTTTQIASQDAYDASISDDGQRVAYAGWVEIPVSEEGGAIVPFVTDTTTGVDTEVTGIGGATLDSHAENITLSGDGRYVAYFSTATNAVAGDTDGDGDVFVWDRTNGSTVALPKAASIEGVNDLSVNADGSRVAVSAYGYDPETDEYPEYIWVATPGGGATSVSLGEDPYAGDVALDATGNRLAYVTTSDLDHVRVRDFTAATTVTIPDLAPVGSEYLSAWGLSISANGQHVGVGIEAGTWGTEFDDSEILLANSFVWNSTNGEVQEIPVGIGAEPDFTWPGKTALSTDGRFVAFDSFASNLVQGDTNDTGDVFLRDFNAVVDAAAPAAATTSTTPLARTDSPKPERHAKGEPTRGRVTPAGC